MDTHTAPDTIRDYRALRETQGAVDLAAWAVLRLEGPDTRTFLQGLGTQDFESEPRVDPARTTLFLSEKGRPVALAWALVALDGLSATVIADEGARAALRPHFERFHVMEEVEISGPDGAARVIGFAGPERAAPLRATLATITGSVALESEPISFLLAPADTPDSALPRFVDPAAYESWRVAAGLPRTGIDFDLDRIATELDLPGAISLDKGCYVGQEVVARTSSRGQVRRRRVGFRFEWSGDLPAHRAEIVAAGKARGYVTSAAREPGTGDGLGMGFISTDALEAAAQPLARIGGREIALKVAPWPL